MYHYFVSYRCSKEDEVNAFGMSEIIIDSKIDHFDDLLNIAQQIKETNKLENVLIINFILLRVEEDVSK